MHHRPRSRRLLATLALACAGASVAGPAHAADTTPPTIHITVPDSPGRGAWVGWYAGPVDVAINAVDDDRCLTALLYRLTGAETGWGGSGGAPTGHTVTHEGVTTLTVTARDCAGNEATRAYGVGLDLSDPTIAFSGSATTTLDIGRGEVRPLVYTCADQPTAVISCAGRIADTPFTSGDLVPTETNGPRTVTVTAVDAVGRRAERSFAYTVVDPRLEGVEPPRIEGHPDHLRVGQTYTVVPPTFHPAATGVTYRWTDAWGSTVHEGRTFVARREHLGVDIKVVATGTRDGYAPTEYDQTDTVRVVADLSVTGRPSVTTAPVEGASLRVAAPASVDPAPEVTRTIWTVGSRRVDAEQITLTGADVGQPVGCEQVYRRDGYTDVHAPCVFPGGATTVTVAGHAWTVLTAAALKGRARVGTRLRAVLPVLSGPATSYSYRWLRGGKPIKSATGASYKLRKADAGRKVTVRVTASTAHRADTVSVATPKRVHR
ncbi:hypothetical protein [Nocardioides nitrophenolicus]|uniref:hypothetical protein n=1 Tax=Nocardioides nitrophenolicus TaxID=60489 RepID=UPI001956E528|nr:hypothetical protein [Nocardioides nitrophenolicus]MBM7518387.1 hypothetical protein [Nocardioides nitrophenolicus]